MLYSVTSQRLDLGLQSLTNDAHCYASFADP